MRNPKLIILGTMIVVLAIGIIILENPADTRTAKVEDDDMPLAALSLESMQSDTQRAEMMSGTSSKFTSLLNAPLRKKLYRMQIQNEKLSVSQVAWLDASDEVIYSGKDPEAWDYADISEKGLRLALKGVSLTTDPELADWLSSMDDITHGKKTVTLIISDEEETEVKRISLIDAYPVSWEGPDPQVQGKALTIQCIKFAYGSLEIDKGAD